MQHILLVAALMALDVLQNRKINDIIPEFVLDMFQDSSLVESFISTMANLDKYSF